MAVKYVEIFSSEERQDVFMHLTINSVQLPVSPQGLQKNTAPDCQEQDPDMDTI